MAHDKHVHLGGVATGSAEQLGKMDKLHRAGE